MPLSERSGNIQIDLLHGDLYIRRRDVSIGIMIPAREVADLVACVESIAKVLPGSDSDPERARSPARGGNS